MKLGIEFVHTAVNDEAMAKYSEIFPAVTKKAIDEANCTILGSTRNLRGVHGYLRWGKWSYANVRPTRYVPGLRSPLKNPEGIDFIILRENLEGLYPGYEGDIKLLAPLKLYNEMLGTYLDAKKKGHFAVKLTTEAETKLIAEYACKLALERKAKGGKGKVTAACKYNVLTTSDEMFRRIIEETVRKYPGLVFEQVIIDNFCQQMIINPQRYDVVAMSNEHGDILADGAAGLIGGLGVAPNACIGKDYAYFGSVHGTAPDIAGMNIINPTAMMLSGCMMLEYLGFNNAASRLEKAIYGVYQEGKHLTRDQGGKAATTEFVKAVKANL
jgi:isocitrate/isopropylmalate dehydrogenase